MTKIILFSLFLITGQFFLDAQTELDLKTALKHTVENHSQVQQASLDIEGGKQTLREAISTGLPQINANATLINNLSLRTSFIPAEIFNGTPGEFEQVQFGTNWNANAGIELNQMLFNKQWLLAVEGTKKLNEFYQVNLELSKEEVIYETAKLYYQIQLTHTQKGILQANLDQINGLLILTEKQFQNGLAKKIDVDQLRVQESNLIIQLSNLDLQIEQMEQALKFAMQMPLNTKIILTDTISEDELKNTDQKIIQPSYGSRPALEALNVQQELYDLDFRRWKAGYFPTVNLFANYTYEWQANEFGEFTAGQKWTDFSQVGLYFNFPIFDGMLKDSKMEMAQINKMKTRKDHERTMLGFQLQYLSALNSLRLNKNNLEAVIKTKEMAEVVYRVTQKRYKEGIAPITELLNTEAAMREAQSNYVTTLGQLKLAEIELMHANGKLIYLLE